MKNIVIINSTLRRNGNSEALAKQFALGATEVGNNVKTVNLREIQLKYCIGCLSCLKTGKCVQNDGINELLPVVQNADILVFATPIYYYSICGQLKTFLDRMNPLYETNTKFHEVYLLATSAEDDRSAMDGALKEIDGWISCFKDVKLTGVIYGIGADAIGTIQKTSAYDEAYKMGKSLV